MTANLKVLAGAILASASSFEWSLQGMGMLRLHLPNHYRLHVWDSRYRVPNVSMIHDHLQWGLESTIIAGRLINRRYSMTSFSHEGAPLFKGNIIRPGVGGGIKDDADEFITGLLPSDPETYDAGDTYTQRPNEIHESDASDGTVTLIRKLPTGDESAQVFWPLGSRWVSAEPRRATPEEVQAITQNALVCWF